MDTLLVWFNSGLCSQQASHSFWVGGRPLPLCARDLGLFAAFLLAAPLARRSSRGSFLWLAGLLPLALDGANSFAAESFGAALYEPTNVLRLATGALAGLSIAFLLAPHLPGWPAAILPLALLPLLFPTGVYLTIALLGTAGAVVLAAAANRLAIPRSHPLAAWALALPELALLAFTKQGLLLLLR